jgi:hypothetical protein
MSSAAFYNAVRPDGEFTADAEEGAMEYLVGVTLAFGISCFSTLVRFDRDRAFYPTILVVIASYYGLFAVMGGSVRALMFEVIGIAVFVVLSILGFKVNLWWIVGALAMHGIFDLVHGYLIADAGVPSWWPMFCLTYDVTAAAYLAWLLGAGRLPASAVNVGVRTKLI